MTRNASERQNSAIKVRSVSRETGSKSTLISPRKDMDFSPCQTSQSKKGSKKYLIGGTLSPLSMTSPTNKGQTRVLNIIREARNVDKQ